jgi:putative transposase
MVWCSRRRAPACAAENALPGGSLARLPRYSAPGMSQHVIQRGSNFVADSDYGSFRDCRREACERHGCQVHADVLMTNHVHLLMKSTAASGISEVMQAVGRRYVQ